MIEQENYQGELPNHLKDLKPQVDSLDQYVEFLARDTLHNAMKHADEKAKDVFEYGVMLSEARDHFDNIEQASLKHSRTDSVNYDVNKKAVVVPFISPESVKEPCVLYRLKAKANASNINMSDPQFDPMLYVEGAKTTYEKKAELVASGQWFINPRDAIDSVIKEAPKVKKAYRDTSISSMPTIEDMPRVALPFAIDSYQGRNRAETIESSKKEVEIKKEPKAKPRPGKKNYESISGEELKALLSEQNITPKDLADRLKAEHSIEIETRSISSGWVRSGVPMDYLEQVKTSLDVV